MAGGGGLEEVNLVEVSSVCSTQPVFVLSEWLEHDGICDDGAVGVTGQFNRS